LPKLHKGLVNLAGRPIVGATQWATTPWSIWLETILSPIICPFHLKNSLSLINQLQTTFVPENSILISGDVSSLYTNMKIELLKRDISSLFNDRFLSRVLGFICDNNYFLYGSQLFKQLDGIAMGTNCAVTLAKIYLRSFDSFCARKFLFYRRYIDDIFAIFVGDPSDLEIIFSEINSLIDGIHLEFVTNRSSIPFLDLNVMVSEGVISFSLYQKPINIYQYIPHFSYHNPAIFKGLIYGELIRICRVCSLVKDRIDNFILLFRRLLNRGYSSNFLVSCFARVNLYSNPPGIVVRDPFTKIIAFVTPFSRKGYVKSIKHFCHRSNENPVADLLKIKITAAFQKQPSLLSLSSRSNISPSQEERLRRQGLLP
jgi:hypothetical protein